MAFDLRSFANEFWGDVYSPEITERPTTIADAVASAKLLRPDWWHSMAEDVFGVRGELLGEEDVMRRIEETDTCTSLTPPVEVWIDPDGLYRLAVWD